MILINRKRNKMSQKKHPKGAETSRHTKHQSVGNADNQRKYCLMRESTRILPDTRWGNLAVFITYRLTPDDNPPNSQEHGNTSTHTRRSIYFSLDLEAGDLRFTQTTQTFS
ncbi:hypothetical protein AWENTII_004787 [Aspergillus wentii]